MHSIIYNVTDEMKKAMSGLLEPTLKETRIGAAEVRQIFKTPKVGTIAGCMVIDGRITRSGDAQARLLRDGVVVWKGRLASLRRFKDDCQRSEVGHRVRHLARTIQRHQGRRHHRGLHRRANRADGLGFEAPRVEGSGLRTSSCRTDATLEL